MLSGNSVQIELVSGGMVPSHAEEWWQNTDLFNQVLPFLVIILMLP